MKELFNNRYVMISILTKIEIKKISEQIAKYAEQLITEKLSERMNASSNK